MLTIEKKAAGIISGIIIIAIIIVTCVSCLKQGNDYLSSSEKKWLNNNKESLEVLFGYEAPPNAFYDEQRQYVGLLIDYLKEIEMHLDIQFRFKNFKTWDELIEYSKKGRNFIVVGIARTDDRSEYLSFTGPFIKVPYVIVTKKNNHYPALKFLEDKKVCTVKNYAVNDYIKRYYPAITPTGVIDNLEGLRGVSTGAFDAMVVNQMYASWLIGQQGITNLKIANESGYLNRLSAATSINDPALLNIIEKTIDQIDSGRRKALYSTWVSNDNASQYKSVFFILKTISVFSLIIVIAIWLWLLNLRRTVRARTRDIRQSEENLRITLNSIGDGVIATNIHGIVTRMNPAAERISGWDSSTSIGSPVNKILNIIDTDTGKNAKNPVTKVLDGGVYARNSGNNIIVKKNGENIRISDSGAPITDSDGNITGAVIVIRDVSDDFEMKERLKQSEADLVNAQYLSKTGGFTMDVGTGETVWTKGMYKLLKYDESDPINYHSVTKIIHHPDDLDLAVQWFEETLQSGQEDISPNESRLICKDGEIIHVHVKGTIQHKDGKPYKVFGIIQDITKRKEAEIALYKSEKHFRTIMEQSPIAMQIYNTDGTLVNANKSWLNLWGISGNPPVGKYNILRDKKLTEQNLIPFFKKALSGELADFPAIEYTTGNTNETGRGRIVKTKSYPLKYPDGSFDNIVIFNEDITEQRQAEEDLVKVEKLKSIGTLAGGIAHDFNNILTGLSGNISLARETMPHNKSGILFLEEAEKSLQRAIQLSSQLLTFSKGGEPVKNAIDLYRLAENSVKFDLSGSNVMPVFTAPHSLMPARADKSQIQQVFSILTLNAHQAMPDGGHIYISFENTVISEGDIPNLNSGNYIKIIFKDDGTGITRHNINKVFDPYFSTKENGSGLGLATAYSILSRHQGSISVESDQNGTIFTMYLPATTRVVNKEKCHQAPRTRVKEKTTGRILVMDDEEIIRKLAVAMLTRFGYYTVTACEGEEAIKLYKEAYKKGTPFDAVIMDLTIPGGLGGKETIKEIMSFHPEAVCIVSSGYADDPVMANFTFYGFKAAVAKPYTVSELEQSISKVLEEK